jgi:hypothetical protein
MKSTVFSKLKSVGCWVCRICCSGNDVEPLITWVQYHVFVYSMIRLIFDKLVKSLNAMDLLRTSSVPS